MPIPRLLFAAAWAVSAVGLITAGAKAAGAGPFDDSQLFDGSAQTVAHRAGEVRGTAPQYADEYWRYRARFNAPSPWKYDYNRLDYTADWAAKLPKRIQTGGTPEVSCTPDTIFCGGGADPEEIDDCQAHQAEYSRYHSDRDGNIPGFLCESRVSFGEIGELHVRIGASDGSVLYKNSTPLRLVFRSKSEWHQDKSEYQIARLGVDRWTAELNGLDYGGRKGPFYFQGGFQINLAGAYLFESRGVPALDFDRIQISPADAWISIDGKSADILLQGPQSSARSARSGETVATFETVRP